MFCIFVLMYGDASGDNGSVRSSKTILSPPIVVWDDLSNAVPMLQFFLSVIATVLLCVVIVCSSSFPLSVTRKDCAS